jgi:hypothetical protein
MDHDKLTTPLWNEVESALKILLPAQTAFLPLMPELTLLHIASPLPCHTKQGAAMLHTSRGAARLR